jgi:hypothetical protein
MKTANILIAATALALAGCMTDRAKSLLNPPGIHVSDDPTSKAAEYGQVPVTQYYDALDVAAYVEKGDPAITNYVDKGIGLVSGYCVRWFQRLDDAQRILGLQQKDFNIIRQLGTALLGIGSASSSIVATYGAANTAYSGIVENFNEAVLAGPTTAKIKGQVQAMLNQSEAKLREDAEAGRLTFAQAYSRIELHADTCTFSTVRNLLDSSLASTKANRDPETGIISSERIESTYQYDESSAKLRAFWRPKNAIDSGNQTKLTQWLSDNGLGGVSIPFFINTAQFAPFRAKAVKDLKL